MAILQWDEWYETGILSIDHQHHNMFDALNRMHDAISLDEGEAKVRRTLDALVECTVTHFKEEEARLAAIDFPDLLVHQAEHAKLLEQVSEYLAVYHADPTADHANRLAHFLVEWIVRHINEMDLRYIEAMKAKGMT
jgi:hemerythrin-like metal-binding protein